MSDTGEDYKGYRGEALAKLKAMGARVWGETIITNERGSYQGIILPRSETDDDKHIVLKLETGYNIGLTAAGITKIEEVGYRKANYKIPESEFPTDAGKPNITLLGTGGTIASRLDYRTGAVIPAFSPGELYGAVPELADICNLKTRKLYGVFSENMGPEQYIATAKAIAEEVAAGVHGIVIGHGTDTMHHTASILSFMVQDLPIPVVMVGSQRSSDRPSSDAARNLICAVRTAADADIAEVVVCMFGPTSDQFNLLHRGTRVRKMHSSYRSAFRTIGDIPLARVWPDRLEMLTDDYIRRDPARTVKLDTAYEEKVTILYYYPGMRPDLVEAIVEKGYRGIVIAGTGLGHVNRPINDVLAAAIRDHGVHVIMTVQTLWGYVQMYVYDTGRDLLELGIVPCANMLPEAAFMKLSWVLGHTDDPAEVKRQMLEPINHEITPGEPHNGYLVFQGGIPEVEAFVRSILK